MPISDADLKLLWGNAGATCSNPACRTKLTARAADGRAYIVGEMAHVIARQPLGPRGDGVGGDNSYDNLILLCPTCHTRVDKSPDEYSLELLRSWKAEIEAQVQVVGRATVFADEFEMRSFVSGLLAENHEAWQTLGPGSEIALLDPGSNAHLLWELRKVDLLVPNNRTIINAIENNRGLLNGERQKAFAAFKNHAGGFEAHQNQKLDYYPQFPKSFEETFSV